MTLALVADTQSPERSRENVLAVRHVACHDGMVRTATIDVGHILDVPGVRVGHHARATRGWLTGTTVVIPDHPSVAGVNVRGAAPGTRETDLLRPDNLIQRVHAICLSGGSAYGLQAAHGVMLELERRNRGFPVGSSPGWVVPIVPAAVVFDLGRGGVFANRPDAGFGEKAVRNASARRRETGAVGAGTGARAGGLQGGVGAASRNIPGIGMVGALVVVNSVGNVVDVSSGLPWESSGTGLVAPDRDDRRHLREFVESRSTSVNAMSSLNTVIGVVATDVALDKAECSRVAAVAHDGLARAVRPAHSMNDGDAIFAVSTAGSDDDVTARSRTDEGSFTERSGRVARLNLVLEASAEVFSLAVTAAIVNAVSQGAAPAYRDLCPSAYRRLADR